MCPAAISPECLLIHACQFLRALRDTRSQRALVRRLGYVNNPITDREHGRRVPTIHESESKFDACV